MCFSASASFTASAVLTVAGVVTLKQVKRPQQFPLGIIPLIFAIQQAVEGWIWLMQAQPAPTWLESLLAHIFPFIAYTFWTIWVVFAVRKIETDPLRRKILSVLQVIGIAVGLFFLYFMISGPLHVEIINHSIHYAFHFPFYAQSQWLYGIAIIGATLVSSHKLVNIFGIGLIVSYNIARFYFTPTYPSVFCFFSALISVIIYLQLRFAHRFQWRHWSAQYPD
ncbi:MAG TPA: hypothetical protein ENJ32_12985 [Crenotrichaceae bacterium]|nr:hypothetical protein [Crenotrichaceae bacterium]